MNVVDSSCWLEYFAGSKVGDAVAAAIEDISSLVIPSITLYEVFKKLLVETNEDQALLTIAHMKQGRVIELDAELAIYSAKIGKDNKLALADSIIPICYQDNHNINSVCTVYVRNLANKKHTEYGTSSKSH